jgi:hypothetical protein
MISDMISTVEFIVKYGFGAICLILFAIVIYLVRKIATNHLFHIDLKLDEISSEVKSTRTEVFQCKERIAKLEGKLE